MGRIKQLAGETLVYGMGAVLPKLVSFLIVGSFLTFQVDKNIYGAHAILYAYVTLAMVLFTLRMETTFFRFAAKDGISKNQAYNQSMSLVISISALLFSLLLLFRQSIADFVISGFSSRYIIYFAVILFLDAISAVPFALLRQENKAMKFSIIKIVNSVITALFNIFFYLFLFRIPALDSWYNESYLLDYTFIANIIGSVTIVALLYKEILRFRFKWDTKLIRNMMRFAWPLIIVGIAGAINQFADRVIIENMMDSFDNAGLFTGAIRIAVVMNLFITAFNYAAEPFFFKNLSKESRTYLYGSVALVFTICGMTIFLSVMVFIDIFKYIIDPDFHTALYIVPFALMANFLLGLYYNFSMWYKLSGKTIYGAIIAILGSCIFITTSILLIPELGMIGANIASILCFSVMLVLAYFLGQRNFPIHYPVGKMITYILLAISILLFLEYFSFKGTWRMIIGGGAILFYLGTAYLLDIRKSIR